jgi:hypothetical protein
MRNDIVIPTRILLKKTDSAGAAGTVPSSDDHTDGTWLETDLYDGEALINTTDRILYMRCGAQVFSKYLDTTIYDTIYTKSVPITAAQIKAMHTTPIELVSANDRAIEVLSASTKISYVSTPFATSTILNIGVAGATAQLTDEAILKSTASRITRAYPVPPSGTSTDQLVASSAIVAWVPTADPTAGDSGININLIYRYLNF